MKCPHCGIYYMDEERVCPVCGKPAGISAPTKKKQADAGVRDTPKSKPVRPDRRKQSYNNQRSSTPEADWERAARGVHTHDNPLEKRGHPAVGCLIGIIVFVCIALGTIFAFAILDRGAADDILDGFTDDIYDTTSDILEDDIYQDIDVMPDTLQGTWINADGSLEMTIEADEIAWRNTDGSYSDTYPLLYRINMDADDVEEYFTDEELRQYPPESYDYYNIFCMDTDNDDYTLDINLFVPSDTEAVFSITIYDYETSEYETLTKMGEKTENYA